MMSTERITALRDERQHEIVEMMSRKDTGVLTDHETFVTNVRLLIVSAEMEMLDWVLQNPDLATMKELEVSSQLGMLRWVLREDS